MSDWQVGDLAVCVDDAPLCRACDWSPDAVQTIADKMPDGVLIVTAVSPPDPCWHETECGLAFNSAADLWCACQFRKIRPDEHESCEPEFVTLIKRSKVSA